MASQQMLLGAGASKLPFYDTTYEGGTPSWTGTGTLGGGHPTHPCYSGGTDTYGDYVIFGPRDARMVVDIYDASNGNLVYELSTTTGINTYGIGMNSVTGKIYCCDYGGANVYEWDISSHCTNNADGTKLTFTSSSGTNNNSATTNAPWATVSNDSRCDFIQHLYFPHDTSHPFHDHWLVSGRGSGGYIWVYPDAGNNSNYTYQLQIPSGTNLSPQGPYGGGYDWQTNSIIVNKRSMDCTLLHDGTSSGATAINVSAMQPFNYYNNITLGTNNATGNTPEDMFILRNGDLCVVSSQTRYFGIYSRTS